MVRIRKMAVFAMLGMCVAIGSATVRTAWGQPPGGCSKEGDPAFYVDFGDTLRDVTAGNKFCWTVGAANFGFVSGTCPDADTFCVHVISKAGWTITADPPLGVCAELDPGYLFWQDLCITVPCYIELGERDTLIMKVTYCDEVLACRDDCTDCEDPNWYDGNPYYSIDTVILQVVPSPPALCILQDSLSLVRDRAARISSSPSATAIRARDRLYTNMIFIAPATLGADSRRAAPLARFPAANARTSTPSWMLPGRPSAHMIL